MNHIFDSDIARLTYFKLTHDNFTNMLMNAQAFSSATKKILSLLEEMIGNPISLYYANRRCFASTGEEKEFLSFNSTIHSYSPDIITRFRYQIQEKDGHSQYVVKVNVVDKNWVYLVIDETMNTLEPLDYMALENAIITLQYGFIGEYARNEMEKKYQKDIGYGLLTGTLTANEMDEVAHMLTLNEKSMYCVVSFHTIPHNKDGIYTAEQLNEVETIEEKIAEILSDEHIYRNLNQIMYIHELKETYTEFRKKMEDLTDVIKKQIKKTGKRIDFQIGIGKTVKGYRNLKESFEDSLNAIRFIDIVRTTSNDPSIAVVDSSKLGFFRMFTKVHDRNEMLQYVPESIIRLKQYDDNHDGNLTETLQVYIDNNQSTRKTAELLFANYRTITYRLEKIKKITGVNFDNPTEILAIRNGMILISMAEKM